MLFKRTAETFVVKVMTAVINLLIIVAISHWAGAQGKGSASLILAGITMILLFCNMVGGASLVYLVPRYNILQLAVVSNVWSVIVCVAGFFILRKTTLIPSTFIVDVCMLSLLSSFIATNITILLGKERIKQFNYISLLQAVLNLVVMMVLIKSLGKESVRAYVFSLYIAFLAALLISSLFVLPHLRGGSAGSVKKITGELMRLGFTNQLGHIMKFASFRMSYFLLSAHAGNAGVGIFSNGTSLVESILLISNSIVTVQYSTIANSTDKSFAQSLTIRLTRISILVCSAALLAMLLLPASFFVWLFGNEFSGVKNVILWLAPGLLFYNVALIIGHYFSGTGKYFVNTLANLAGLVVTLLLSLMFLSSYNIFTASIISTIAYVFTTLVVLYYFKKESKSSLWQLLPSISDFKWARNKVVEILKP